MRNEQGRKLGFELAHLYRATPDVNALFLDLLGRSDPLVSTGACKALYYIVQHLYATGKLLAKSANKPSNSKIQILSSASTASSFDTEHGILLNEMAFVFLDKLMSETRDGKPTLQSVIFADAAVLFFQVLCVTLNSGMSYFGIDMKTIEDLEEKDEILVGKLKKMVPQFVASILSWYGTARPLYRPLLREMLRKITSNASDSLMSTGALVFGDLLELPVVEAGLDELPISRYLEALEQVLVSLPSESDFDHQWFIKAMHLGLLISKPPIGVREPMIVPYRDRIIKCMCETFQRPGIKRETVELAVAVLEFVGIGKFDFDAWIWTMLATVDLTPLMKTHEPLLNCFVAMERKKEMRVAMLNLLLQSWSKAGAAAPLSTNCRLILLFILRTPHASPDLFSQLNTYVQKNAALDKIQKLVADSLQAS